MIPDKSKVHFEGRITIDGEKCATVIVLGPEQDVIEVFDGDGNPAAPVELVDERAPINGVKKAHCLPVLVTKTNPTCVWVYTPAGWRKICY